MWIQDHGLGHSATEDFLSQKNADKEEPLEVTVTHPFQLM